MPNLLGRIANSSATNTFRSGPQSVDFGRHDRRQLTLDSLLILNHPDELRALLRLDVIAAFGSQRGGHFTRDQTRGAIAAEVVPAPLNQDENLVFKFD